MEDEELETYAEVPTEDDCDDYEDSILDRDFVYYGFFAILGCAVFAFVVRTISKHLKNMHLKVGSKIEIGVESLDSYIADLKKVKEILNIQPEDTLAAYVDTGLKNTRSLKLPSERRKFSIAPKNLDNT